MLRSIVAVSLGALALSCGPTEEDRCPDAQPVPIVVAVRDAQTGERICDADVRASDGMQSTTAQLSGSGPNCGYGIDVGAGTYDVSVSAQGYADAPSQVATVTFGACNLANPVGLVFDLQPES